MKTCPFCKASLADNAIFCIYCMSSLQDKEKIPQKRSKKRLRSVILITSAVLVLAVAACVLIFTSPAMRDSDKDTPDTSEAVIVTFDDFLMRAVYLTENSEGSVLSELWDPSDLLQTHSGKDPSGDRWATYSTDIAIDEAVLKVHFCEEGIEVITEIVGLTDETYLDGVALAECTVSSVYNYTYRNLKDLLTDHDTYPMRSINKDDIVASMINLPDSAADKVDEGTEIKYSQVTSTLDPDLFAGHYLVFQLRERIWHDVTYYDVYLLHTTE